MRPPLKVKDREARYADTNTSTHPLVMLNYLHVKGWWMRSLSSCLVSSFFSSSWERDRENRLILQMRCTDAFFLTIRRYSYLKNRCCSLFSLSLALFCAHCIPFHSSWWNSTHRIFNECFLSSISFTFTWVFRIRWHNQLYTELFINTNEMMIQLLLQAASTSSSFDSLRYNRTGGESLW